MSGLTCLMLGITGCERGGDSVDVRGGAQVTPRQYCGVDSLYICCRAAELPVPSVAHLDAAMPPGWDGINASVLCATAKANGIRVDPVRTDWSHLKRWDKPAILSVNDSHYIAFLGTEDDRFVIYDNTAGLFVCTHSWANDHYHWDGVALVIGGVPPILMLLARSPAILVAMLTVCIFLVVRAFSSKRDAAAA